MNLPTKRFVGGWMLVALLMGTPARGNAPAGRYTASGGGVRDNKTALTWQQMAPTSPYTWENATNYCPGLGPTWRLPTIRELLTIVDDSVAFPGPTIDTTVNGFPNAPANNFWSSTVVTDKPTSAWIVQFNFGNPYSDLMSNANSVRCVH
jgi:hypothetical protein